MALTKAEMQLKILRVLGKAPEGQVPSAWVYAITSEAVDQAQAYLEAEGLAYWETSAFPDGVAQGFSNYVAARVAPEVLGAEQAAQYAGLADLGLRDIRRFCAVGDGPVKAVYF